MPAREPRDPLDAALRPPFDESPEEKQERLAKEAEALRISHEIDEEIKKEKSQRKKRQIVRLLLLGQSESGQCTLYPPFCSQSRRFPGARRHCTKSLTCHTVRAMMLRSVPVGVGSTPVQTEYIDCRDFHVSTQIPIYLHYSLFFQGNQRLYDVSVSSIQYVGHPSLCTTHALAVQPLAGIAVVFAIWHPRPIPTYHTWTRVLTMKFSSPEFQRLYTPTAFREERVLWRSVIQLNIVRSIRTILDAVQDVRRRELPVSSASEETEDEGSDDRVRLPLHLETLAMRLLPLRHIEALLVAKLVPPNEDEATHLGHSSPDSDGFHYNHEIFVRPGGTWKGGMLAKARLFGRPQSAGTTGQETQDESQVVLDQCRDDIVTLWKDKTVKDILRKRKIRLEESPGL